MPMVSPESRWLSIIEKFYFDSSSVTEKLAQRICKRKNTGASESTPARPEQVDSPPYDSDSEIAEKTEVGRNADAVQKSVRVNLSNILQNTLSRVAGAPCI